MSVQIATANDGIGVSNLCDGPLCLWHYKELNCDEAVTIDFVTKLF